MENEKIQTLKQYITAGGFRYRVGNGFRSREYITTELEHELETYYPTASYNFKTILDRAKTNAESLSRELLYALGHGGLTSADIDMLMKVMNTEKETKTQTLKQYITGGGFRAQEYVAARLTKTSKESSASILKGRFKESSAGMRMNCV